MLTFALLSLAEQPWTDYARIFLVFWMITIANEGQNLRHTNFWATEAARSGYMYLSWNAGAARLLMPQNTIGHLPEMKTAFEVVITRGLWRAGGNREMIEIMFEDGTSYPFSMLLSVEQCDRLLSETRIVKPFPFMVWTESGMALTLPCYYRRSTIPCLKPRPK